MTKIRIFSVTWIPPAVLWSQSFAGLLEAVSLPLQDCLVSSLLSGFPSHAFVDSNKQKAEDKFCNLPSATGLQNVYSRAWLCAPPLRAVYPFGVG
jgi:hypothetical protein